MRIGTTTESTLAEAANETVRLGIKPPRNANRLIGISIAILVTTGGNGARATNPMDAEMTEDHGEDSVLHPEPGLSAASSVARFTQGPWAQFLDRELGTVTILPAERPGEIATVPIAGEGGANAHLIAAAPTMALYIKKRADTGDTEAIEIWETINAHA